LPAQKTLIDARVVYRRDIGDDLFILWLDLGNARKTFTFKPGQYCTIGLEGIERPYSIVSGPREEYMELFIEYIPPAHGGVLTPLLHKLRVGDRVSMRPRAKGIFTFEPEFKNQVMVSTVTGIVPYISILRDYIYHSDFRHSFFVLHGASYCDEFVYDKEFLVMSQDTPRIFDLRYVATVSRPDEKRNEIWIGEKGRVNLIVEKHLARWGLDPKDTIVYVCGHPGMIEDVKDRLTPAGWKVKEERFWKE